MKYYSEKTKKLYETEEILRDEEAKYDLEHEKELALKAQRAERAKEIEKAYEKAAAAKREADELMNKFIKEYGSYHYTQKNVVPVHSLFDMLFNFDEFLSK